MNQDFTSRERHLLDQFAAPELPLGFADAIVAAAVGNGGGETTAPWPRTTRRAPWLRRGILGSVGALTLATTAAASGWLGERIVNLPVISSIATIMPEAVKAKPKPKPAPEKVEPKLIQAPVKPAPLPAAVAQKPEVKVIPAPVVAPTASQLDNVDMKTVRQQARVERVTSRFEKVFDRRDARRAERGLPANTGAQRAALDRLKRAETPEDRRAALKDWRALRQAELERINARRATRGLPPIVPKQGQMWAQMMERRCARLADQGLFPKRCRQGDGKALEAPMPDAAQR